MTYPTSLSNDKEKEKIIKEFEEKLYELSYIKDNEIALVMPEIIDFLAHSLDTYRNSLLRKKMIKPKYQSYSQGHQDYLKDKTQYKVLLRRPVKEGGYSPEEQEANCFAAHLLVPSDVLQKYKDVPCEICAALFAVSRDVIIYSRNRKIE